MTTDKPLPALTYHLCGICNAPLHEGREHRLHEIACLRILTGEVVDHTVDLIAECTRISYDDRVKAFQRNAMSGLPAWSPDTVAAGGTDPIPAHLAKVQAEPEPTERPDPFGYYSGRPPMQALPPGRARCHVCNGLNTMYPDCFNCEGKGYL